MLFFCFAVFHGPAGPKKRGEAWRAGLIRQVTPGGTHKTTRDRMTGPVLLTSLSLLSWFFA